MVHSHQHMHHRQHARAAENVVPGQLPSRTNPMERSRVIVARTTCTNDSDPGCTKPTSTPTIAIALAVIVPIVLAAVVLFFLHRRHLRKLREEDVKDKYKSLDFGMGPATGAAGANKKGRRGAPEMINTDMEKAGTRSAHEKGMSIDMDVASPYILPAGLHSSRESFHSLSRSTHDPHDPYGPVTFNNGADGSSIHSSSRPYKHDNSSVYTASSAPNDGLLKNAQIMPHSLPPRTQSKSPEMKYPDPVAVPLSPLNPRTYEAMPPPAAPKSPSPPPAVSTLPPVHEARATANTSPKPFPRVQSQEAVVQSDAKTTSFMSNSSFGDGFQVTPPSPTQAKPTIDKSADPATPAPLAPQPRRPERQSQAFGLGVDESARGANRLSMSLRPLPPPSEETNESAEQRANRIRSFYKEYFDDSKPEPENPNIYNDYYDDYTSEYLDGTVFDPETGSFVVAHAQGPQAPFAQPVTRRAMTPPPRAPPRFRSNTGPRGAHMSGSSMASSSRFAPPRNMSSMSGRMGPRKPAPPPVQLSSLPTPAQLKEDTALFNAMDFAPPVSFRERQNGMRPDSPLGNPRPFSPMVRPHTPLASAYDDLAAMPSPHLLRKSGTFTALDFAPPPRFRDADNMSDAGSIRSNRSGMSHAGRMAVRNGAYRVSKIPKEMVTTRDDLSAQLRPTMDMVSKA
ncbi:unnamed protein product [Periconia digitata]|uniref:Uncharacterized protein n=1 Tax=Periconia digitata TaxID=1303443 RepID=A0A9W4UQ26_9PLEO|nr:unnamed protein product [Periconia digitata]